MKIKIKTIKHSKQRYNTAGDYFEKNGVIHVLISDTGNKDYNFLTLIHELVELHLCKRSGISFKEIDDFDMKHPELDDPGSDWRAPYKSQHASALRVELALAIELGIDWSKYEECLGEVCK